MRAGRPTLREPSIERAMTPDLLATSGLAGSALTDAIADARTTALRLLLLTPRPWVMFQVAPFLSPALIPGSIRRGLVLMIALLTLPLASDVVALPVADMAVLMFKEALVGLMLGLGMGVFVWAVQSVGDFIDFHTGASNAAFFDPAFGHQGGPTGQFLGWLAMALFLTSGGLVTVMGLLVESYRVWPQGALTPDLTRLIAVFAIHEGESLFTWIVKLGAPVLLILMLVDMGLGLIGRFVPQLNIFIISQPLKSLVAVFMLLVSLGLLYETLHEFMRPDASVLHLLHPAS